MKKLIIFASITLSFGFVLALATAEETPTFPSPYADETAFMERVVEPALVASP